MNPAGDFIFYQSIELPGVGLVAGSWDHRETVDAFLGKVDFRGKKVLDVGPANGFFSFEIEKRGGCVTAVDLGQNTPWDVVPHPFLDHEVMVANMRENVRKVENAFWFGHKALNSKVELVYGSVYDVPKVVKNMDIALMSNVLQHFRDPLLAMERVAQVVGETMVVTETIWHDDAEFLASASARLLPRTSAPEVSHSWWQTSPSLVIEFLQLLGFPIIKYDLHLQKFNGTSSDLKPRMVKHFTITARRPLPLDAQHRQQLEASYATGFHDQEADAKHNWRWCAGPRGEILVNNHSESECIAGLSFGLSSITPDASIKITLNGKPVWEGASFHGPKPVYCDNISLVPGNNVIEFVTTGKSVGPTARDGRVLSFMVYDFDLCQQS